MGFHVIVGGRWVGESSPENTKFHFANVCSGRLRVRLGKPQRGWMGLRLKAVLQAKGLECIGFASLGHSWMYCLRVFL